jgi:UDP-N-acetylmuramoyl-tripeptide--D-alanyl-D-alanine ligase
MGASGERPHLTFALQGQADVTVDADWSLAGAGHWAMHLHTPAGELPVALSMPGLHNLRNALAAATCALAAGAPLAAIREGLERFRAAKGRSLQLGVTLRGHPARSSTTATTPTPTRCAPPSTCWPAMPGPRWLVLGDMGEVGRPGPRLPHRGRPAMRASAASNSCVDRCAVAPRGGGLRRTARHFETPEHDCWPRCRKARTPQPVLVKGSRFMRMERVVEALKDKTACCLACSQWLAADPDTRAWASCASSST